MLLSFRLAESREEDQKIIYRLNHCENRSGWIREALLARIQKEEAVDAMLAELAAGYAAAEAPVDDQDPKMTIEELASWIHNTGGRSDGNLEVDLRGYNEEERSRILTLLKGMEVAEDVCKEH